MATVDFIVSDDDTAIAVGSGSLPVLGTPRLIAWLEAATVAAVGELAHDSATATPMRADQTTVGTRVDVEHLLASPVGARVEATAEVTHRDGRLLRFSVAAHHDVGEGPVLIGRGEIIRVIVDVDRFLARLASPRW